MTIPYDDEIITTFLTETREHLEEIEQGMLIMESRGNHGGSELVSKVFRAAHSIKAGANLLGMRNIEALAHELEEILHSIRQSGFRLTAAEITLFLAALDQLNELIEKIQFSDIVDLTPILTKLKAIQR